MQSRILNRGAAKKHDKEDEDTKAFLLNRKIEIKRNRDVLLNYTISEFLGSGKFGDVNKCLEKATGYELAAKIIPIQSPDDKESVMREVKIMSKLRHPRLIQLYDVYENTDKIVLIMELITGGELFERVIDDNFELDEARCCKFMKEILQGVNYIHSQKVLHLDLKPENILCLTKLGFKIKIIDFGLSREVNENDELRVLFGTPEFIAPEVISYDPVSYASDMWSVGVICYVLLSGLSPFMGDNEGETLSNIVRCVFDFNYTEFNDISSDAKDFIKMLLVKDTRKRYTSSQCLSHPWFKERSSLKRCATVSKKRLRHFVFRRKWQKAVNAIIALQRMGVVLTHSTEKPEIRKYLKAQKTKTSAVYLRKGSLQAQSSDLNLSQSGILKRNSIQNQSTPTSPTASQTLAKVNDSGKIGPNNKPLQFNSPDPNLPKSPKPATDKKKEPILINKSVKPNNLGNVTAKQEIIIPPKESKATRNKLPEITVTSPTSRIVPNLKSEQMIKRIVEPSTKISNISKTPIEERKIITSPVQPTKPIMNNYVQNNSIKPSASPQVTNTAVVPKTSSTMAMITLSKNPTSIANKIKLFSDGVDTKKTSKPKKRVSLFT